jgi:hypothetical protein
MFPSGLCVAEDRSVFANRSNIYIDPCYLPLHFFPSVVTSDILCRNVYNMCVRTAYVLTVSYLYMIMIYCNPAGHCPSADDPRTLKVETDCENVTAKHSAYQGSAGNLCHVDCANRGICDYKTGLCQCFNGHYGSDCSIIDAEAVYEYWNDVKVLLKWRQNA